MCIRLIKTFKFLALIALPFAPFGADGCTFAMRPFIFMENQIEIWKDVVGAEGLYEISSFGRLKSLRKNAHTPSYTNRKGRMIVERIMAFTTNPKGYLQAGFFVAGKQKTSPVHRLVAQAFIPNPLNKPQINHINGIKNDNRVENLEWCTNQENVQHAFDTGLAKGLFGADNKHSIPISQFTMDGIWIKDWSGACEVQREIGICQSNITACTAGRRKSAMGFIWKKTTIIQT